MQQQQQQYEYQPFRGHTLNGLEYYINNPNGDGTMIKVTADFVGAQWGGENIFRTEDGRVIEKRNVPVYILVPQNTRPREHYQETASRVPGTYYFEDSHTGLMLQGELQRGVGYMGRPVLNFVVPKTNISPWKHDINISVPTTLYELRAGGMFVGGKRTKTQHRRRKPRRKQTLSKRFRKYTKKR